MMKRIKLAAFCTIIVLLLTACTQAITTPPVQTEIPQATPSATVEPQTNKSQMTFAGLTVPEPFIADKQVRQAFLKLDKQFYTKEEAAKGIRINIDYAVLGLDPKEKYTLIWDSQYDILDINGNVVEDRLYPSDSFPITDSGKDNGEILWQIPDFALGVGAQRRLTCSVILDKTDWWEKIIDKCTIYLDPVFNGKDYGFLYTQPKLGTDESMSYKQLIERQKYMAAWTDKDFSMDLKTDVDGDGLSDIQILHTMYTYEHGSNDITFYPEITVLYANGRFECSPQNASSVVVSCLDITGDNQLEWALVRDYMSSSLLYTSDFYMFARNENGWYNMRAPEHYNPNEDSFRFDYFAEYGKDKTLKISYKGTGFNQTFKNIPDYYFQFMSSDQKPYAAYAGCIYRVSAVDFNGRSALMARQAIPSPDGKEGFGFIETIFYYNNGQPVVLKTDVVQWINSSEDTPVYKKNYSVTIPKELCNHELHHDSDETLYFREWVDNEKVGGIELLNKASMNSINHSELVSSEELKGYPTKVYKRLFERSYPAASGRDDTYPELHVAFEKGDIVYDLWLNLRYGTEEDLMAMVKSFELK